jgi:hypothetical protein
VCIKLVLILILIYTRCTVNIILNRMNTVYQKRLKEGKAIPYRPGQALEVPGG